MRSVLVVIVLLAVAGCIFSSTQEQAETVETIKVVGTAVAAVVAPASAPIAAGIALAVSLVTGLLGLPIFLKQSVKPSEIREGVAGYKTYVVAGSAIASAAVGCWAGEIELAEAAKIAIAALGGIALRAGMKNGK